MRSPNFSTRVRPMTPSPACRSRDQVLDWHPRGRLSGRDGQVVDITCHGERILVTISVTSPRCRGHHRRG